MAASAVPFECDRRFQSILAHLPISTTREYRRGEVLYRPNDAPVDVSIVLKGVVAVWSTRDRAADTMLEVFGPEELIGEGALLHKPPPRGRAAALADVIVMSWDAAAMHAILRDRPHAGLALVRALVRRNAEYAARIESFSLDSAEARLAWSLLRLAERLGEPDDEGWVRLVPLTHTFLAVYLGASRAAVTLQMNRFRKRGWLTYSRQEIRIQTTGLRLACRRLAPAPAPLCVAGNVL
jgi:CRP-like cAMP-binding protein